MTWTGSRLAWRIGAAGLAVLLVLTLRPAPIYGEEKTTEREQATAQVERDTQAQVAEERGKIIEEALAAMRETGNALTALDEEDSEKALLALERATGKLEILLARDPNLALVPVAVTARTQTLLADIETVRAMREDAEELLDEGRLQHARRLLDSLASETVISTSHLPLATYPQALKRAASLIHNGETDEAKVALQTALDTLIVNDTIIPIPVATAEELLDEAKTLAEKSDRSDEDAKRLGELLDSAEREIRFAEVLGYGAKDDFKPFYEELDEIREKTEGGKYGKGFFKKVRRRLSSMMKGSQAES